MKNPRNWLILLGLYLGVPTAMLALPGELRVRAAIPVMLVIAVGCLCALPREKRGELADGSAWLRQWPGILLRFLAGGLVLALLVKRCAPGWFLSLVLEHPHRWLVICLLYPLLSVCPQELIYRVYFFDLAGAMFPRLGRWWLVGLNAVLFGYAHIVFGNPWAPLLAAVGGAMFASTYSARRSFWPVAVEHALWGDLLFTLGLGALFAGGTVARLVMP